ncbi:MAG: hypothetical protein M0C28_31990 [Candidatus Moduliflexus flocculans]|nr:hypothetical protein [Candidatus Moduliflexus flocculans]
MGVIWSDTILTQKLQRYVFQDIDDSDLFLAVEKACSAECRTLPLYAGDAEVFDYNPGTLKYTRTPSDFHRLESILKRLSSEGYSFVVPSKMLALQEPIEIDIATAAHPIRTKKQDKYNVTRWAVTGRESMRFNTQCYELYRRIAKTHPLLCGRISAISSEAISALIRPTRSTSISATKWDTALR